MSSPSQPSLTAPIRQVIVLEDRAQVFRRGRIQLAEGTHRVIISNVTALLYDRSLVGRVGSEATPSEDARVDGIRLIRKWHTAHESRGPEHDALRDRALAWVRTKEALDRQTELTNKHGEWLASATDLAVQGLNRELKLPMTFADRWPSELQRLFKATEDQAASEAEISKRQDALEHERQAIVAKRQTLSSHDAYARSEIEITVTVTKAGEFALEASYVVPCAAWRPTHRAVALEKTVSVESSAALWQASGEDWNDVELWVSTARPTKPAEPPALPTDLVTKRPKVEKKTVVAIRETTIATTGAGGGGESPEADLPGVDDGGETRLMRATGAVSVPSDGKMRRSPLFTFEAPAEWRRVCRPQLDPTVHPICTTTNKASSPLMPGPIDLIGASGFVGRGQLDYTAPGEKLELDLGASDELRVKRWSDEKRETARLTGKQTITREVRLFISNLQNRPGEFTIEERVPVSELADVQVEVFELERFDNAKPDTHGIMRCPIKVRANGTHAVAYTYRIIASSSVEGL